MCLLSRNTVVIFLAKEYNLGMGKKKKAKESALLSLYRRSPVTNNILIDIALDKYLDFFHEWDNATFRKRDINPGLAEFLDICSEDIPMNRQFDINFHIKNISSDLEKEKLIIESYNNYYNALKKLEDRKVKRITRYSIILFIIALGFIFLYILSNAKAQGQLLPRVLLEGLIIGGWVFMWEALHMLFFDILEPFKRKRELERFLRAKITFSSEIEKGD